MKKQDHVVECWKWWAIWHTTLFGKVHDIGQRESFFRSRDENESFSDSISFIETRPRVPDTYSQASRRDREFLTLTLGHRDEIEIYYLHSQASRREREFPWSDLVFRDETENSETCHLSLKSGLNGLTILHAIFGRLTILNAGPHILLDVLPFWNDPVMFFGQVYCDFFDCCHKCHNIECFESSDLQIKCLSHKFFPSSRTAWLRRAPPIVPWLTTAPTSVYSVRPTPVFT